jgi:hypothetical protein
VKVEPPKPVIKDLPEAGDIKPEVKTELSEFPPFLPDPSQEFASAKALSPVQLNEFHEFEDPLEGMDMTGFVAITGDEPTGDGRWDGLQHLMGEDGERLDGIAAVEDENTSVAPALQDAIATSGNNVEIRPIDTEEQVRAGAAAAEGELAVPYQLDLQGSGVPTEEVNEIAADFADSHSPHPEAGFELSSSTYPTPIATTPHDLATPKLPQEAGVDLPFETYPSETTGFSMDMSVRGAEKSEGEL